MARQCTQPKRSRNAAWFKKKAMLAEAQEFGQILDEEQLAFLTDLSIPNGQAAQTTIPNTAAFQTKDLDDYDSDCDDVSNAKAVLMANLSNYGSDVISVKAQRIKPTLYDGSVISSEHATSHVIDDEETLILEEVSRSKMLAKQYDPMSKEKKVNTTPINYVELNRLSEDFGKRFVSHQEFSDEQAFWLQTSHPNIDQSASSPVKIESPKELPKEHIKSMRETEKEEKVKHEMNEIETINIELEHRKETVENATQIPIATTIAPGKFKIDLEPLAPRLLNNMEAHIDYLKHTQEQADTLQGIVEQAKAKQPLDNGLDFACKVFTEVGHKWKPIGRLFSIVSNSCPLTRITPKKIVHLKETTSNLVETQEPAIKMFHLLLLLSMIGCPGCPLVSGLRMLKTYDRDRSQLMNFVSKFMGTVRFRNDQVAKIIGYGDYQLGNVIISRVYYVEALRHNLFFVRQFCNADLEVAFRKNTCFIWNLEGVDLHSGSRDTNLYIISLDDMLKTSLICLLSKASKTKSWLWHRQLSHLNFGTLNKLAKDGLARDIPKLKFQKDHLCSTCALGKSKKSSHQPKAEDTNQEKLYLLHMDLCGPMCVESINRKKYILVIVDDYSRFTWTLRDFYENVSVSHQTSIARTPLQNGIVKRRNQTLIEVARIMLIISKAPLFLWAEAINTTCYTQNHSLIRLRYNKTPYEMMYDKKPDLLFLHVFGSLCYPTNDSKDMGKLNAKADIGPGLQFMTPATSSSGLVTIPIPQQPCNPPNRDDWDRLFQPMFDEYFNPPTIAVSPVPVAAAPRAVDIADSPVSTSIDQDAPSTESPKTPHFHDDPLHESLHKDSTFQGSSSNVRQSHTSFELIGKWTKDHPIANVIGDPSCSVSQESNLKLMPCGVTLMPS
ncbi:retrovirus-related pol polyprotein from transposon TNT 1-94 [Tanacetum coccineum]|uniref:Retrovirus-related pol polyprotein from transposon TNT 1-94 n=1 Tax=Tanacetum coccineum TaxID=301880 RepID=A0ABQ5FQQ2_9ASTR